MKKLLIFVLATIISIVFAIAQYADIVHLIPGLDTDPTPTQEIWTPQP